MSRSHPGLINLFVNQVRRELEREKERRPSVLKKLKEAQAEAGTKPPTKKKEVER